VTAFGDLILQLLVALLALTSTLGAGPAPVVIGLGADAWWYSETREPYVDTFWINGNAGASGVCSVGPTGRELAAGELKEYRIEIPYRETDSGIGAHGLCLVAVSYCPGAEHAVNFDEDGESHGRRCIDPRCELDPQLRAAMAQLFWQNAGLTGAELAAALEESERQALRNADPPAGVDCTTSLWQHFSYPVAVFFSK